MRGAADARGPQPRLPATCNVLPRTLGSFQWRSAGCAVRSVRVTGSVAIALLAMTTNGYAETATSGDGETTAPPATTDHAPPDPAPIDRLLAPPRHRPWFELVGALAVATPERDAGLSHGRATTLHFFVRPIPYVALGAWYAYRHFDWVAVGFGSYYSADEEAWSNTWGAALRAYPLGRGRFDPHLELGLGSQRPQGTVNDWQCTRQQDPKLLRAAAGVDAYLTRWIRFGVTASMTGARFGGSYTCTMMWIPDEPPAPPDSGIGGAFGLSATLGAPTTRPLLKF